MIAVPWFVSWSLLFIGLFLLAWGIAPAMIYRGATALPSGGRLVSVLNKFDLWLAGDGGPRSNLDRLSYKMDDGLRILNRVVNSGDEFRAWVTSQDAWIVEVFSEIETHFSRAQAVTFRSVGSVFAAEMAPYFSRDHNTLKLHLDKRIDNLRNFLDAESAKL